MRFLFLAVTATIGLLLGACGAAEPASAPATESSNATAPSSEHAGHGDMQMDESVPFDAQFIDSMIEHHQGAIDMAQLALDEAEREELRTLAETIIAAQEGEIEQMQLWRDQWYPDLAPTGGMQMGMGDMMISGDESKPFDQRFIEAMISHHQGAIDMARMVLEESERDEMRTLAEAIIAAQEAEIEQMQQWLEEWYGDGESGSIAPSYAGDLASPVRGLTAQEVDDLLNGRGMALARMAELNNHPGPRHLLDLQAELALSPEQIAQIEEVFSTMQAEAQALGKEIVQREQALSDAFAEGTLESAALQTQVLELGDYYARLRAVHLQAHLQVTPLLSAQQITRYNELRGYAGGEHHPHMH